MGTVGNAVFYLACQRATMLLSQTLFIDLMVWKAQKAKSHIFIMVPRWNEKQK